MSLRYKFHHLFFGGKINKKRLYQILVDLDKSNSGESADISELENSVGALETAVGDSDSGLVKDVADIETAIGDESTEGTILARIKALEDSQ